MKRILMLLALVGVTSVASTQQTTITGYEVIQIQDKYQVITSPFWDNWFFSIGGGVEVMLDDNDHAGKFRGHISPTLNVAVGKWFTPGLGLRLQHGGLQGRGSAHSETTDFVRGGRLADGYYRQKFSYMNLHGDVVFNLNALLGGYNSHRIYEITPYLGVGFAHSCSEPHREAFTMNVGVISRFRVSSAVDINIEIGGMLAGGKFDGEIGGRHGYNDVASLTAGLAYHPPTREFTRPMPQIISEVELTNMRHQISEMAAANQSLQQQLVDAQNQSAAEVAEQIVVADANIAPRTIFFTIDSFELSPREEMNLSCLATKMRELPDTQYIIYGYADSATGIPAFSKRLSRKRTQTVVSVLVKKYGVDSNRLKVDAGGGVNKFGKPIYLNRIVLVESAK